MTTSFETKMRSGKLIVPVTVEVEGNRMYFNFKYSKPLMDEIKVSMEGRKWHGYDDNPRKVWSAPLTLRNLFVLEFLRDKYGTRPYDKYDAPIDPSLLTWIKDYCSTRVDWKGNPIKLYSHQLDMIAHGLQRHNFVWACEMGTGKTLAAMVLMEMSGKKDWIWVGPKSALRAVDAEMDKWQCRLLPRFITYEGVKKVVENWESGKPAPDGIIFDEASKLKTPTSQRSVAAKHLSDSIHKDHKGEGYIGLLSGTPAPKSPVDWWHLCEVAQPGFLREGTIQAFRERLSLIEQREKIEGGGAYPHHVTWFDDSNKCKKCSKLVTDWEHNHLQNPGFHPFEKSVNEVAQLEKRLNGLVLVKMKKDCLELPEKIYLLEKAKPTKAVLRAAQLITTKSTRTIEALTLLRELSDGFQYQESQGDLIDCPLCLTTGKMMEWYDPEHPTGYTDPYMAEAGLRLTYNDDGEVIGKEEIAYQKREAECSKCHGVGKIPEVIRTLNEYDCPKDQMLIDQLELHEDVGRLCVYAGFTASVDRVLRICKTQGWTTIRADGRGWEGKTPNGEILPNSELLKIFDRGHDTYPKVCFVGQAGAAGMGLTLTASPSIVFWSNDFNSENRWQAEDRGHRIGMDVERGGRIIDFIHLEADEYVLENLKKKKDLQMLSMLGLQKRIKESQALETES